MDKIIVHSPATVSNLVCGFDVLGFAVNAPYDVMELRIIDEPRVRIRHADAFNLPEDPEQNIAGVVLRAALRQSGAAHGFDLLLEKRIRPGSGIGSSAASAAGAAVAANHLLGNPFSRQEVMELAMVGEALASGTRHADNIAPCVCGGVTLIRSADPLDIIPLSSPPLFVTLVHPQLEIKTSYARSLLPPNVPLKDAVKQWANVGGLVAGFLNGDTALMARSMEDFIVEPVRSRLIPGFDEVKEGCREAGVIGGGISGSGPSLFMLSSREEAAREAEKVMQQVFNRLGIDYHTYVTNINPQGVSLQN